MNHYKKKHWLEFLGVGVLSVLAATSMVALSLILQHAIDFTMEGKLKEAIGISVIFMIVFTLVFFGQAMFQVTLNQKLIKEMRETIVNNVIYKSYVSYEAYKGSSYLSLMTNDVKKIEDDYIDTIFSIFVKVVQLILAIVVMTRYSWVFTVVMLGMTVLMFLIPAYFSSKMQRATEQLSESQNEMTRGMNEIVQGFEVIKTFQQEEYRLKKFDLVNKQMKQSAIKLGILKEANSTVSNVLAFCMQMVICILAAYFIYQNKMSYGSMVGVIQVSGSITNPLFGLFYTIPLLKSLKPIWKKIEDYTKEDKFRDIEMKEMPLDWREITIEHVNFQYPHKEKNTLEDISIKIERGKKYLLIGESGGGKSTLVKLLCGYYQPDTGSIMVDGDPNINLQHNVAMIHQNIFLFDESIKRNITIHEEGVDKLQHVIETSNLKEVVEQKGIDFVIGENGKELSGGQKQRVAIARALYSEREIIILDEGFSALDSESANEIEKKLLQMNDITVISISHHTTPEIMNLYDQIIEVKAGKITNIENVSQENNACLA